MKYEKALAKAIFQGKKIRRKNWKYGYYIYFPDLRTAEDQLRNSERDSFFQPWEEDRESKDWEILN